MRLAQLELSIGRSGKRSHHTRHAECAGAGVSLSPTLGDDVHDTAATTFFPVVSARPLPLRTRRARADLAAVERRCRSQPKRRIELAAKRFGEQPAIGN